MTYAANTNLSEATCDETEWAERGNFWRLEAISQATPIRDKHKIHHAPLILCGHGMRISVDRGTLFIKNGFTHYPQKQDEYRYFQRDKELPSRIIILDGSGNISFSALKWLSAQGIILVQLNWSGEVINVGCGFNYAADRELVRLQTEAQFNVHGLEFATWLISQKIENCISTVQQAFPLSPITERSCEQMRNKVSELESNPPSSIRELLGVEAQAALIYFKNWRSRSIQWKLSSKDIIPEDWHRIGSRQGARKSNQFAKHPVNAMLNYAYGILENQVRLSALAAGFDPTIGYIHTPFRYNRQTFIFDLMEPVRPLTDCKIFELVQNHIFSPADFYLSNMGVCKLHPQFAALIVKHVQNIKGINEVVAMALKEFLRFDTPNLKRISQNAAKAQMRLVGKRE